MCSLIFVCKYLEVWPIISTITAAVERVYRTTIVIIGFPYWGECLIWRSFLVLQRNKSFPLCLLYYVFFQIILISLLCRVMSIITGQFSTLGTLRVDRLSSEYSIKLFGYPLFWTISFTCFIILLPSIIDIILHRN